MKWIKVLFHYLLGIIGILLISAIPAFFNEQKFQLDLSKYLNSLWTLIQTIFSPSEWVFLQFIGFQYVETPLFSFIFDNYVYSMTILLSALLIALILGFIFAVLSFQIPRKLKNGTVRLLNSLEALPDVLFIFLLQLFVVWFFKQFDVLLFRFVTLGDERVYLSPILSLTILPTILFFKVILLLLEEESSKDYVLLAKSKGFRNVTILIKHCLPNIKKSLFVQSKPIIWATLSSLLVVEYLHNFYGIVSFVFRDTRPFIIFVALLLIFTPFYILFSLSELFISKNESQRFEDNTKLFRNLQVFSSHSRFFSLKNPVVKGITLLQKTWISFITLCRKPKFVLGIVYILGFSVVSFGHSLLKDEPVEVLGLYQDENGEYHKPAHPPGELLLGSDAYGHSVYDMLIVGAKYTILFTLLIAFLRLFIGYLLTIPYMFWLGERSKQFVNKIADGMQFLPLTLIAYVLLIDVVRFGDSDTGRAIGESLMTQNIILEVTILVIFVIPVIVNTLGNEANSILKSEHIQAAIVLGASKSRIFFKHITSHLFPQMIYLMGQQMIQVLQVLIHLGVFSIFIGGGMTGDQDEAALSFLYDWTSMFENMRIIIVTKQYWLIIPPLTLYVLLIFSIQAVTSSILEEQQRKIGVYKRK